MNLPEKFKDYIQSHHLFDPGDQLIIAVSGGVDSVVLCELCKQAGFNFVIAHCNFQLRGEESERDETFVKSLAEKYKVKNFIKKFETEKFAEQNKLSIQLAARGLRYNWFDELIKTQEKQPPDSNQQQKPGVQLGSSYNLRPSFLLTAHHANDNIETLLMNFFKGTGIGGLKGIVPKKGKIIRPLLFAKKEEILKFSSENNLHYVEDSSNTSDKYTRNYFRNKLIPSLQKVFPGVEENLMHNIERFGEIEELYRQVIDQHKNNLVEKKGNEIHIPVLKLLKTKSLPTVLYEIIKDFGFTSHQADETIKLLNSESGKYISSATHKIIKNRNWIIIASNDTKDASNILINVNDREIEFANGKLKIERETGNHFKITPDASMAFIDADTVTFPLLLRQWKKGDYFYPLGMTKASGGIAKKKLGKFFIDQKLSLTDKEKIWVIENNKRIVWIVGKRIDDRFKVKEHTANLIKFQFNES